MCGVARHVHQRHTQVSWFLVSGPLACHHMAAVTILPRQLGDCTKRQSHGTMCIWHVFTLVTLALLPLQIPP